MAEIVNLRMARKKKRRAAKEQIAAENRARHGQTKRAREVQRKSADSVKSFLDGHSLIPSRTGRE